MDGPSLSQDRARLHRIFPVLVVCIGALLYGYTLSYPFLFDDHIYLLENPLVTELADLVLRHDFTSLATYSHSLGLDPDLFVNLILRPVTYLTFHLNHLLTGWDPRGFRAVNIVIHCLNSCLIFAVVSQLIRHSTKEIRDRAVASGFIGGFASLLFLAHPLATESVTYIVQRFTSLSTFFYLAVLASHFRAHTAGGSRAAVVWKTLSVAALVAGMLSKEILFTAPILLVLLDYLVMGTPAGTACRRALPHMLCLPLIPTLMFLTSNALENVGVPMASMLHVADPTSSPQYQYHYALTQPGVIVTYLRMLILPFGLNIDPDHPMCRSFFELRFIAPLSFLLLVVAGPVGGYLRHPNNLRRGLVLCGVFWFFLGLALDSSIVPLPDVMAEHRSYFPSIGIFLVLACGADWLRTRWTTRPAPWNLLVPGGMTLWVGALGVATVARNQVWSSEVAMWKDAANKSPNKPRVWTNLGSSYARQRLFDEAHAAYKEQLRLAPRQMIGYVNLAAIEVELGRYKEAIETATAGTRVPATIYEERLYYVLGRAWLALGDVEKSIDCAVRVVTLVPRHAGAHRTLMELYFRTARFDKSLEHGLIAASLIPEDKHLAADILTIRRAIARQNAR